MSFWDVLFGRDTLKRPKLDGLFALPSACVNLETGPGWSFAGRGGICLKRVEGPDFRDALKELDGVVELAAKEFSGSVSHEDDPFGYRWYLVSDDDVSDLVNTLHSVATIAGDHGFDGQLLAGVVRFQDQGDRFEGSTPSSANRPAYLIYNYKRGAFYAFAPKGKEERDNAAELRVQAALSNEVPWEKDLGRWYPLWDCPV